MERDYQEIELYKMAQKRIKKIKDFYVHLIVYIVINSLIFLQNSNVFNQFEINFNFGNSNLFFLVGNRNFSSLGKCFWVKFISR